MSKMNVEIPDIGDATDVEVIEICVEKGSTLTTGEALIVIESDKASMEVPSPCAGTVEDILVALGDLVNTGDQIVSLAVEEESTAEPKSTSEKAVEPEHTALAEPEVEEKTEPKQETAAPTPTPPQTPEPPAPPTPRASESTHVYAGPAVRKLARELGAELTQIEGTGTKGRITTDDVKLFVKQRMKGAPAAGIGGGLEPIELPDFSRFGPIQEVPLSRIRKKGAVNLHKSWIHVAHVTQHDEADVTDLENFRSEYNSQVKDRNERLSPLPFILKAVSVTLREFPQFNASIHPSLDYLIQKQYYYLGMAVDTPDGLVVPVIRDVDQKGVIEISSDSKRLAQAAQTKKLHPNDLTGATFTVSSLGHIGGTGFTPIINMPEVAILGVSRLETKPCWINGIFVPRKILPLSLSYDHRAINGAEAGRFMQYLRERLADIRMLAL